MPLDPVENTRSCKQWRKVRKEKRDAYLQAAAVISYPNGTGSQSVTSYLSEECPQSERARKPLDLGALDSDDDIVYGDRKLPELVVLDSDDDIVSGDRKLPELVVLDSDVDIVSGDRSVSDIENGIFEEIARLDSLKQ